jgi:hypothetical protein
MQLHKIQPFVPVLIQMKLVCALSFHFFEIYFNVILSCKPTSCKFFLSGFVFKTIKEKVKFAPEQATKPREEVDV